MSMFGDSMFITLWLDEMINCYAKFACIGGFKLEVVNVIILSYKYALYHYIFTEPPI